MKMKVLYKLLNYYELLYIHKQSKHPPSITKQISSMINKRISNISCDKECFDKRISNISCDKECFNQCISILKRSLILIIFQNGNLKDCMMKLLNI